MVIRRPDGTQAAPGEVGVLYARSPMLATGYDGDGGCIVPFTDPVGWATVGDLPRMEPGGMIFLEGRADEAINTGGAKVYPVEVEAVLAARPAVSEVAVFGLPGARRGEVVAAAVVLRPGARASERDLHAFCATRLAPYKRPRVFHFVPELPRTDTGKVAGPRSGPGCCPAARTAARGPVGDGFRWGRGAVARRDRTLSVRPVGATGSRDRLSGATSRSTWTNRLRRRGARSARTGDAGAPRPPWRPSWNSTSRPTAAWPWKDSTCDGFTATASRLPCSAQAPALPQGQGVPRDAHECGGGRLW